MDNSLRAWSLAVLGLAAVGCGAAQDRAPGNGAVTFIERLGIDTFAIEAFRRTSDGIEGRVVVRSPETRMYRYRVRLEDGWVRDYELEWFSPPGDVGGSRPTHSLSRTTVSLAGDSALVRKHTEGAETEHRVWAPPGVIPIPGRIPPPPLLAWAPVSAWLLSLDRVESSKEPLRFLALDADPPRTVTRPVETWGRDSVGLKVISGWTVARLDGSGEIESISGGGTTVAVEIERADALDLESLAADYAARDARGDGIGYPSPFTRTKVSLAGATIEISYGRPAMRGRRIWGGLVPYGEVWRTGANPATHLHSDRDLQLGPVELRAGSYTLWSLIEPSEAWLIVNRQTRQWGTEYDPAHDLARIPMRQEKLEDSLQLFTIDIRAFDGGRKDPPNVDGQLRLAWDHTRFTVPIRVR